MTTESGKLIKKVRLQLKVSQASFGKLLGVGQPQISKYETGTAMPDGDTILSVQKIRMPVKKG